MIINKIILVIFCMALLSGCAQNASFLGPIYTFTSTGNVYQTGLSYGSEKVITTITGKSSGDNIKDLIIKKDDSEFDKLVKRQIKKTRKKLKLTK